MANIKVAAAIGTYVGLTTAVFGQSPDLDPDSAALARYTVTRLSNIPGGTASYPAAVNAAGEVAGTAYDNGTCHAGCPIIWSGKTPKFLGQLPGFQYGSVNGMNDLGQVVGTMYAAPTASDGIQPEVGFHGTSYAIVWDGTKPTILGKLAGDWPNNSATGINNAGEVVGWTHNVDGPDRALLWHGTAPHALPIGCYFQPIINGPGLIACTNAAQEVSVVDAGKVTILPQLGGGSVPYGINDTGLIVGISTTPSGETHAVAWKHDRIIDIAPQGIPYSTANGVNAQGHIVGSAVPADNVSYAVYWPHSKAKPQDLNKLISASDAAKYQLAEAVAINDQCTIVAWGSEGPALIYYTFVLTLKPEFECQ
jgi:probable HAF family extracellular repeat protein